jgi:hypothetical protein
VVSSIPGSHAGTRTPSSLTAKVPSPSSSAIWSPSSTASIFVGLGGFDVCHAWRALPSRRPPRLPSDAEAGRGHSRRRRTCARESLTRASPPGRMFSPTRPTSPECRESSAPQCPAAPGRSLSCAITSRGSPRRPCRY